MFMVQACCSVLFIFQAMAGGMTIYCWSPFTPFIEKHLSTFFIAHADFFDSVTDFFTSFNSVNGLFASFNFHDLLDSRPGFNKIYTLLVSSPSYILDTLGCLAPTQTRAIPNVIDSLGHYVSTAFNFLLGLFISASSIPTDTITSNYPSPSYYIASAVNSYQDVASNTTAFEDVSFSATFSSVVSTTSKPSEVDPEALRAILTQLGAYERDTSNGLILVAIMALLVALGGIVLGFKLLNTPRMIEYHNCCPCAGTTALPTMDSTGNVLNDRSELGTLRQKLTMPIYRHGRVQNPNTVPTSLRVFDTALEYLDLATHTSQSSDICAKRIPIPCTWTMDTVASIDARAEHVEQDSTPGSRSDTEPETPTSASLRRATEMINALASSPISSISSRLDLKQQGSSGPISSAPSTPPRLSSSNIAPSTPKRGRVGTVIDLCTPPITRSLLRKTRNVFGPFLSRRFIPEKLRDEFPGMSPSSPGSLERGLIWLKEQASPARSARIKAQYEEVMTEEVRAQHPWAIVDSGPSLLNSPSPLSRKQCSTPLPSLSYRSTYVGRDLTPGLLFDTTGGSGLGCVSRSPTRLLRTPVSELRAIVAGKPI